MKGSGGPLLLPADQLFHRRAERGHFAKGRVDVVCNGPTFESL